MGGGGRFVQPQQAAGSEGQRLGGKLIILHPEYFDTVHSTDFQLFSQIHGNSVNN
jgi:hypothetical protein